MIEIDETMAYVESVEPIQGGFYRAKVCFPDVGLYISGIRAKQSKYPEKPLWVQLPSYVARGKRIEPFECSENGPFKQLLIRLITDAVSEHEIALDQRHPSRPEDLSENEP